METKERGASDLHLTVGLPPMLRLDGVVIRTDNKECDAKMVHDMIYSILSDEQKVIYEEEKEIDFSIQASDVGRFRVNVYCQRRGDSAVFRIIPEKILSLEDLNLHPTVTMLAHKEKGLILVTGHTGSGKSTTLAAIVKKINEERQAHIITIEDPIEFIHPHINSIISQREVGSHTKSFSSALYNALREDPDVILVGELRDLETVQMAITAAETGRLVLATVHTNSCASTVDRIVDVFPGDQQKQIRMQFANSIQGVLSQKLLPRADGKGRVCALEIMVGSSAITSLIREKKSHQILSTIQIGMKDGMVTMDQSLKNLLDQKLITKEVALKYMLNPEIVGITPDAIAAKSSPSSFLSVDPKVASTEAKPDSPDDLGTFSFQKYRS